MPTGAWVADVNALKNFQIAKNRVCMASMAFQRNGSIWAKLVNWEYRSKSIFKLTDSMISIIMDTIHNS